MQSELLEEEHGRIVSACEVACFELRKTLVSAELQAQVAAARDRWGREERRCEREAERRRLRERERERTRERERENLRRSEREDERVREQAREREREAEREAFAQREMEREAKLLDSLRSLERERKAALDLAAAAGGAEARGEGRVGAAGRPGAQFLLPADFEEAEEQQHIIVSSGEARVADQMSRMLDGLEQAVETTASLGSAIKDSYRQLAAARVSAAAAAAVAVAEAEAAAALGGVLALGGHAGAAMGEMVVENSRGEGSAGGGTTEEVEGRVPGEMELGLGGHGQAAASPRIVSILAGKEVLFSSPGPPKGREGGWLKQGRDATGSRAAPQVSPLLSPRAFGKMVATLPEDGLEGDAGVTCKERAEGGGACKACARAKVQYRADLHQVREHFSQLMQLKQEVDARLAQSKVKVKELEAINLEQQLKIFEQGESLADQERQLERFACERQRYPEERGKAAEDKLKSLEAEYHEARLEAARDREHLRRELASASARALERHRETEEATNSAHAALAAREEEVLALQAEVDSLSLQLMQAKVEGERGEREIRACAQVYDDKCRHLVEREQELSARCSHLEDMVAALEGTLAIEREQTAEREGTWQREKEKLEVQAAELRGAATREIEARARLVEKLQQDGGEVRAAATRLQSEVEAAKGLAGARELALRDAARWVPGLLRVVGEAREEVTALIHGASHTRDYITTQERQSREAQAAHELEASSLLSRAAAAEDRAAGAVASKESLQEQVRGLCAEFGAEWQRLGADVKDMAQAAVQRVRSLLALD